MIVQFFGHICQQWIPFDTCMLKHVFILVGMDFGYQNLIIGDAGPQAVLDSKTTVNLVFYQSEDHSTCI